MSTLVSGHQAIRPSGHLRPVIRAPSGQKMRPKTSMSTLRRSSVNWWCHVQQPSTTFLSHPFPRILTCKIMQTWLGHCLRHVIIEYHWVIIRRWIRVLSCSVVFCRVLVSLVPSCAISCPTSWRPLAKKVSRRRGQKPGRSCRSDRSPEAHEILWNRVSEIFWNLSRQCFKMFQHAQNVSVKVSNLPIFVVSLAVTRLSGG